jgi:hypothetical protein
MVISTVTAVTHVDSSRRTVEVQGPRSPAAGLIVPGESAAFFRDALSGLIGPPPDRF